MAWAGGGTITTDGLHTVHKFTTGGSLVCGAGSLEGTALVAAGRDGGGHNDGDGSGGSGAGGF